MALNDRTKFFLSHIIGDEELRNTFIEMIEAHEADDLDLSNNNIVNVADPVNPQDAATKAYVDANSGSTETSIQVDVLWLDQSADDSTMAKANGTTRRALLTKKGNVVTMKLEGFGGNDGNSSTPCSASLQGTTWDFTPDEFPIPAEYRPPVKIDCVWPMISKNGGTSNVSGMVRVYAYGGIEVYEYNSNNNPPIGAFNAATTLEGDTPCVMTWTTDDFT